MSELVFVEQRPSEGREHPVQPGTTIGREGCDIVLTDSEVSRRHAAIRSAAQGVAIEDLGSTNGTYVNGERIGAPRLLGDGDEVQIGSTVLRLRAPRAATKLAQAQPGATKLGQATTVRATGAGEPPAAAPPPAGAQGRRGDVPPPDLQPSAIRHVVPGPDAPVAFSPPPQRRRRASAATRLGATIVAGVIVALTAAGVVAYYITEPFK
jgi:predicted component of type VI protein secretion system